ncbi:MAG: sigma 54-interacting transcriptional regulator [Nitrospirota bacterium]
MELDFRKNPSILATMVDAMADGVFTVDAKGNIVAWSAGAERITGYRSEELVGQPAHVLEGPSCKGFSTVTDLLSNPSSAPAGICHQECKILSRSGQELYLHGNVRLLTDEEGTVVGAIGTFSDLTSFVLNNERISLLEKHARSRQTFERLVGKSSAMQEVFRRVRLAAESEVPVLVTGESGTGKELVAGAIHSLSGRKAGPFLAINCSAIPETLLESELFGHVKGAFTGATKDKLGMFQAANGGTLFLDEVGDTSPLLQLKLLRVLQEREVRRVGEERPIKVDVRLVAATNRDLKQLIRSGAMREDFYYRIRVFEIRLPPLRERREDIPLLVDHFMTECARDYGKAVKGIARDALKALVQYCWPGNVRELKHAIEYAFVTVGGDRLTLLDFPPEIRQPAEPSTPVKDSRARPEPNEAERARILKALNQANGSRLKAARLLGYSRVTLWKKLRRLGIPTESFRR